MLFRAQHRMPFDIAIQWLREHVRPVIENAVSGPETIYPDYTFALTDIIRKNGNIETENISKSSFDVAKN